MCYQPGRPQLTENLQEKRCMRNIDNTLEIQNMTAVTGYALCSTMVKAIPVQHLAGTRPFLILGLLSVQLVRREIRVG